MKEKTRSSYWLVYYTCRDDFRPLLPSLLLLFGERILQWNQLYKFSISSHIPRSYRHSRFLQAFTTSRGRRHYLGQAISLLPAAKLSENTIEIAKIVGVEKHTTVVLLNAFVLRTFNLPMSYINNFSGISAVQRKNPQVDRSYGGGEQHA